MDEIRIQDRRLFVLELTALPRLALLVGAVVAIGYGLLQAPVAYSGASMAYILIGGILGIAVVADAYREGVSKRFKQQRFGALWRSCEERLKRFEIVLRRLRTSKIADVQEMPKTVRSVGSAVYSALRKADLVFSEVQLTEREVHAAPPVWQHAPSDRQSQELYQLADRNIAEYRQQYADLLAGVQRAEAQAAVYMTTLDNLRMKMLGYRLVGRSPEMNTRDFLSAMAEAKLQLQSIDRALEELDLGQYPKTVEVVRPGPRPADPERKTPPPIPPGVVLKTDEVAATPASGTATQGPTVVEPNDEQKLEQGTS